MGGDIFGSGTACTVHLQPAYTLTVSVVTCSTQLPQVSRAAACVPVLKVLQVLHLSFICPPSFHIILFSHYHLLFLISFLKI